MNKKALIKNMIANMISFGMNAIISFFLTSYIVGKLGSEAYGFVRLADEFTGYVTILTIALNSMATRFIMISMNRNPEDAKKYYNSVIVANMVLSAILVIPSVLMIIFCNRLLDIPAQLVTDVRINFAIVFTNFIVNLLFSVTSQVYYLTNKLYIGSIKTMQSILIKTVVILGMFYFRGDKIYHLATATICATTFLVLSNLHYRRKLLPEMNFDIKDYQWSKVKTVMASGIWNSINQLSQVLSNGCDTLISNVFINSASMGLMSISKTIPNLIANFQVSLASVFTPNLTEMYAKNEKERLKSAVKASMRIMCVFTSIPNAILVATGMGFFRLWTPGQNIKVIYILALLASTNSVITGVLQPIYSVFTITNKVKKNAIAMMIYGASSVAITLILLRTTSLGVYAISGVSQIGSIFIAMGFHLPQGSKALKLPMWTFLPEIGISALSFVILSAVGIGVSNLIPITSWGRWILCCMIIGIIGIICNGLLVLNKEQRSMIIEKFRRKI